MGRKPTPAKLKVIEGNPGKRPIPEEPEAPIPSEVPDPPSFLDEYAKDEWVKVAEGLNAMKVLSTIDEKSLAAYCQAYSVWRRAEEELAKLRELGGEIATLVVKNIQGNWIQQPLISISSKAASDMVRYASEFGMTPAARARLAIQPPKKGKSKFEGLMGAGIGEKE